MSEADNEDFHFGFKAVLLGDKGVGKTSLVAFHTETAVDSQGSTAPESKIGVNFKIFTYEENGLTYRVDYWDSPGDERSMKLAGRYCAGATGAMLVFDVCNRASFEHVEEWLAELEKGSGKIIKVLVGNKADLPADRHEVTAEQARLLASKHGMSYFETSTLTRTRVSEAFLSLVSMIIDTIPNPPEPSLLLKKNIRMGKNLSMDPAFRAALHETNEAHGHGKNATANPDWN